MSDFIAHLQHRVADTKRRLQEANDRIQKATAERDTLAADLQGYERTLAAEMRSQGVQLLPAQIQQDLPLPSNGAGSKTDFARHVIKQRAGVSPAELFQAFNEAKVPIGRPYIYALIQRLQKQGQIQQRRGKWVAVEADSE